jgi:hypothetical protein
MGMRLRLGRFFDDHDRAGAEPVVVIDEVLARAAFGDADPIGRALWIPQLGDGPFKVIGVTDHVRHWGLATDDQARVRAQIYYPFAQLPDRFVRRWSELMSIAVRTSVPPLTVVDPLRRQLRGAAGDQVLYEVRTLEQLARGTLARDRFLMVLFGIFSAIALLMACLGIYGVLSFAVSRRVPEIGVRVALGAATGDVMRLVFRQSATMIVGGISAGALAGVGAGRVLEALVDGVRSVEPATFAAMIGVLTAAALLATYLPARRASRIAAVTALRQ